MSNLYFQLHACCLLVKGSKRSMVCDVQRNSFHLIPNGLHEILTKHKGKSLQATKASYDHQYDETIDEYFIFLIDNEFGFYCNEEDLELFPDLDLSWEVPFYITNAIVDVNDHSQHDFVLLFKQFEKLGCKHLQIRSYKSKPLNYFSSILEALENRRIISTEFIIKHNSETTLDNLKILTDKYTRIHNVIVHSAPESKIMYCDSSGMGNILFIKQAIDNESHCGIISPSYFSIIDK